MKKHPFILGLWFGVALPLHADVCKPINAGQTVKATCFVVAVAGNEAARLSIRQPIDLEIRVDSQRTVDSFNFGRETATLTDEGEYRVEVHAVSKHNNPPIEVLMSRESLALPAALVRREAEDRATHAKRSGKAEDLSAALEAWRKTDDLSAVGRLLLDQGDMAVAAAKPSEARTFYENALHACQAGEDRRCSAEAANNSGFASQQLGDFAPAQSRLSQAVQEFKSLADRTSEGQALSNLGLLVRQAGDYQGAISYYDRARTILRSRDAVANARVLNNLGVCYQSLAEYDLARNYLEKALTEFTAHHITREAARARLNLGRNFMLQGEAALALKTLNQALAESTAASDRATRADTLLNLGEAFLNNRSAEMAKVDLEEALTLHRASGDRRSQATDLHYLGAVAAAQGDVVSARAHFVEAFEIRRSCGLRDPAVDSLYALADLERRAGNREAAIDYAEQALERLEAVRRQVPGAALRASFYARRREFFDVLVDLESSRDPKAGLLAAERGRGRALMDLLAEGSLFRNVPPAFEERRRALQSQIDFLALKLAFASADRAQELRHQVETLAAEDDEIESRIREKVANPKLSYRLDSVEELQRNLPSQSALIEYHLGQDRSYLWLVKRDSIHLYFLPRRSYIDAHCAQLLGLFHNILGRKRSLEKQQLFERSLREVSLVLVGRLRNVTLPARVIVIPDGVLTQIPFAALEPTNRGLGLDHDVVQLPAAAYLVTGQLPKSTAEFPHTILAIADPVYSVSDPRVRIKPVSNVKGGGPDLARLPFVKEIDTIAALVLPTERRVLRAFEANVDTLERSRPEDYAVLHFSTHAFIDDRLPELSRIALSMVDTSGQPVDGFLRPYQLSRFSLRGSTVVLSACDTALGKQVLGEGLVGLSASLFSAGAARLVLTLSKVDAESSSEFWAEAYRHMFGESRASIEHAVTLARRGMAHSVRWSDPYYWASYAVYGLPSEH